MFGRDIFSEELYSILLGHLPEEDKKASRVRMFGCLRPASATVITFSRTCPPFHCTLFACLRRSFDPMFKLACEQKGLPYHAYTFRDMEVHEKDCAGDGGRTVRACKMHGSVGMSDDARFDRRMIKTTAEVISNDNEWADLITGLMRDHDLALAGYGGHDVDFYPAIRSAVLKEKEARKAEGSSGCGHRPLFWFDRFKDESGNEANEG